MNTGRGAKIAELEVDLAGADGIRERVARLDPRSASVGKRRQDDEEEHDEGVDQG